MYGLTWLGELKLELCQGTIDWKPCTGRLRLVDLINFCVLDAVNIRHQITVRCQVVEQ